MCLLPSDKEELKTSAQHLILESASVVVLQAVNTPSLTLCLRPGEEEGEVIHMGNAIMSFYSALIDLLGRCAPEQHVSVPGRDGVRWTPQAGGGAIASDARQPS